MKILSLCLCATLIAISTTSSLIADEKLSETINPDGSKYVIIKRPELGEAEERFITAKGMLRTRVVRHLNEFGAFTQSDFYNESGGLYAYEVPEFSEHGPVKSIKRLNKEMVLIYKINMYPNFNITSPDGTILTQAQVDDLNAKLESECKSTDVHVSK